MRNAKAPDFAFRFLPPYTPAMRVMTYNLFEGGAGRIDPIAEVVRWAAADVLLVQEALDEALLHHLADRLHMDRFIARNPRSDQGAVAILSRLPLLEAVNHTPLDGRITRAALHAVVATPAGGQLPIVALHLHARETLADEQVRLTELPAILDIAARFEDRPHLLAGDFNSNHPDQIIALQQLRPKARERIAPQNNLHPRTLVERLLQQGYIDAHARGRRPEDFGKSFTTAFPATRVDFIFLSPQLEPALRSCEVFTPPLATYASDHYPVVADLAV